MSDEMTFGNGDKWNEQVWCPVWDRVGEAVGVYVQQGVDGQLISRDSFVLMAFDPQELEVRDR
jgi:hypothetical protein